MKMKEPLAFVGLLVLAISLWFMKDHTDRKVIDGDADTIKSLQDSAQSKADIITKSNAQNDAQVATIKSLQDNIQSKQDMLNKSNALVDSKNETIRSLQQDLAAKDALLAKNNDLISSLQIQIATLNQKNEEDQQKADNEINDDGYAKIYPEDDGFEAENLGLGSNAFQVFGLKKMINPNHVPMPDKLSNQTPWVFSGANCGVVANGCDYFVIGATNHNNNKGASSTNGQAAFLEYRGCSISQLVALPAGSYTVSFDYEGRRNYGPANQIAVSIDKTVLFKGAPTDCDNFKKVTTSAISFPAAGKHLLTFHGLGGMGDPMGDHTTFIDNVRFNIMDSADTPPVIGVEDDSVESAPSKISQLNLHK